MAAVKPLIERKVKDIGVQRPLHLIPESEYSANTPKPHAQSGLLQESLRLDKQMSSSRRQDRIRMAVMAVMNQMMTNMKECGMEATSPSMPSPYIRDYFDNHVVVEQGTKLWAVPFTESGTQVKVGKPKRIFDAYTDDADDLEEADLEEAWSPAARAAAAAARRARGGGKSKFAQRLAAHRAFRKAGGTRGTGGSLGKEMEDLSYSMPVKDIEMGDVTMRSLSSDLGVKHGKAKRAFRKAAKDQYKRFLRAEWRANQY